MAEIITPSGLPNELTEITNGRTLIEVYNPDTGQNEKTEIDTISTYVHLTDSGVTINEVIKASIEYGKNIGELYFLDSLKAPTIYSDVSPGDYFPSICLDSISSYTDISLSNWLDLVPHLRAKALTYNEGLPGSKSSFSVTGWAVASNVATLTFADTDGENAILTALTEDQLVHGSYSNWRSITLSSTIGDISAGEYAITGITASTRQVTFAFLSSDNTGSGTYTAIFYTNRVPGSSTTARLYQATGRTLVSANDGEGINGLRKRDRFQGFDMNIYGESLAERLLLQGGSGSASNSVYINGAFAIGSEAIAHDFVTDGVNGTPRTGSTTHGPESVGHLYIHGRSYSA